MVLDFVKEAMKDIPLDKKRIDNTLAWLNSMLCDKRKEVQTIEDIIFYIKKLKERQ